MNIYMNKLNVKCKCKMYSLDGFDHFENCQIYLIKI